MRFTVYRFYSGFLEHIPLICHFADKERIADFDCCLYRKRGEFGKLNEW
ncbi:hypothetical protein [Chlorobium phaeobacteroides]|nr:hypothetical protein [Chlorobium phaeobacteroides]MBV5326201.1 hypothetical protein [Chlorobium sp.]